MRWTAASLLFALLPAACGGHAPPPPVPQLALSPGQVEDAVTAVITAALEADRHFATADSLWDPDATVVANGTARYAPPRFAGVEPGGEVAITASRLELRQTLVWVSLDYRWISVTEGAAREGKATVLLVPRPEGGWKIIHLHSSTPP